MRQKSDRGKFALMLGAGASISSGTKPTSKIMEELLGAGGKGIPGSSVEHRFDTLWQELSDQRRGNMLDPYLDVTPSRGYGKLGSSWTRGIWTWW